MKISILKRMFMCVPVCVCVCESVCGGGVACDGMCGGRGGVWSGGGGEEEVYQQN